MSENLNMLSMVVTTLLSIVSLLVILIRPIREWLFGIKNQRLQRAAEDECKKETDRCLLRAGILNTYYRYSKDCAIKQYEFESTGLMYQQYKALGGNSFVDKIWDEMQDWDIER